MLASFAEPVRRSTMPPSCAWCGRPPDSAATRLKGRRRCPHCGVATTDPWPTEAELDQAYGGWYRPDAGASRASATACCASPAGASHAGLTTSPPPVPCSTWGPATEPLLDALAARGRAARRARARGDPPRRPRRRGRGRRRGLGSDRVLAFARASGEPGRRRSSERVTLLVLGGRARGRGAERRQPPGAGLRGPLARPRSPPPSRPRAGRRPRRATPLAWAGGRARQPLARRARCCSAGCTASSEHCRAGGISMTRSGAPRHAATRRSGRARLLVLAAAALVTPLAVLCAGAEVAARRGGTIYVEARRA